MTFPTDELLTKAEAVRLRSMELALDYCAGRYDSQDPIVLAARAEAFILGRQAASPEDRGEPGAEADASAGEERPSESPAG